MVEDRSPRFRSASAALRFYFRAGEVLSAKASNRLFLEGRIPATGHSARDDLMLDYLTVASCLKDLNELQRWLLRELYRPNRFGDPAPSVSRACDLGREIFPRVRWTIQGVGRLHRHTIRMLENRFAAKQLIPALQPASYPAGKTHASTASPGSQQGVPDEFFRSEAKSEASSIDLGRGAPQHAPSRAARNAPRRRREVVVDRSHPRHRALPHG